MGTIFAVVVIGSIFYASSNPVSMVLITGDFNRSDSSSLDSNWSKVLGDLSISGNTVSAPNTEFIAAITSPFNVPDVILKIDADTIVELPFRDCFDRPDNSFIGSAWNEAVGEMSIANNQLQGDPVQISAALMNGLSVADISIETEIDVGTTGVQYAGPLARLQSDGSFYWGALMNNEGVFTAEIYRVDAGNAVLLNSAPVFSGNGRLKLDVVENTLRLSFNDIVVVTATDSAITAAGFAGLVGLGGDYENLSAYVDSDLDTLPDSFEILKFGDLLQPVSGDWDLDGLSNFAEWRGGSDPTIIDYSLTLNVVGGGSVNGGVNGNWYPSGTVLNLTATPDAGYTFSGWSGSDISVDNPLTMTMDGAKDLVATFFTQDSVAPTLNNTIPINEENVSSGSSSDLTVLDGAASASHESSSAGLAFDDDPSTNWLVESFSYPLWIKYDFGIGKEKRITTYSAWMDYNVDRSPYAWTFEGSSNDIDWVTLDTKNNYQYQWLDTYFGFPNETAYRYYRLNFNTSGLWGISMTEIDFQEKLSDGSFTSDLTGTGIATGSAPYGPYGQAPAAFDEDSSTADSSVWLLNESGSTGYLQYDFGPGNAQKINRYKLNPGYAYYGPKGWTFEASQDGVNSTVLHTQNNFTKWGFKRFNITNPASYRYYRMNITEAGSGGVQLAEMEMMQPDEGILEVSPTDDMIFSDTVIGLSQDQTFTITNTGIASITGTVSIDGGPFSFTTTETSYTLAPNESQEYVIRFLPTTDGPFTNIVTFSSTGGDVTRTIVATTKSDGNSNGIADSWEYAQFGASYLDGGIYGADGDVDGDGRTNLEEYQNNSNPNVIDYKLSLNTQGSGSISGGTDDAYYPLDTVLTLTADPQSGWSFSNWSGDLSGSGNPKSLTMTGDKTVTAHFSIIDNEQPTINITSPVNGQNASHVDASNLNDSRDLIPISSAIASSTYGGYPPSNLHDGVKSGGYGAGWLSADNAPYPIDVTLDLGSIKTVEQVTLYQTDSIYYTTKDYEIGYSTTGSGYTLAGTNTLAHTEATKQENIFPAVEARYIRIRITSGYQEAGYDSAGLSEVEVYGAVSIVSASTETYPAKGAFDDIIQGDTTTEWYSEAQAPQWLRYDFYDGVGRKIDRYRIALGTSGANRYPMSWRFEGSLDGNTWATLDTRNGIVNWTIGEFKAFDFDNGTVYPFYRIFITEAASTLGIEIGEMELIDRSSTPIPYHLEPDNTVVLQGTASDNNTFFVSWENKTTSVSGNGIGTTNWTTPTISLIQGINIIEVTATDLAGNKASDLLRVYGESPPFNGMVMWLRSDTGVTTVDGSGHMSSWQDQSGHGNHAVQTTSHKQPLLVPNVFKDNPAIVFDGDGDYLPIISSEPAMNNISLFTVYRLKPGQTADHRPLTLGGPNNNAGEYVGIETLGSNGGNSEDILDVAAGWGYDQRATLPGISAYEESHALSILIPGFIHSTTVFHNGVQAATTPLGGNIAMDVQLGNPEGTALSGIGGYPFGYSKCEIAEVIVYNRIVSAAERQRIEAYLMERYLPLAPPTANPPAGFYPDPISVTLSTMIPDAVMRYTLDGTEPNETSTLYSGPISISKLTTLKAKTFKNNEESVTFSAKYDFDVDGDGLSDETEINLGTDPNDPDTNDDGFWDGVSVQLGIDPLANDIDGDTLTNSAEIDLGTDPFQRDTDGDDVDDNVDLFPLESWRWQMPPPDPSDHTDPVIDLIEPEDATLVP